MTTTTAPQDVRALAEKITRNPNGYNEASVTVAHAYLVLTAAPSTSDEYRRGFDAGRRSERAMWELAAEAQARGEYGEAPSTQRPTTTPIPVNMPVCGHGKGFLENCPHCNASRRWDRNAPQTPEDAAETPATQGPTREDVAKVIYFSRSELTMAAAEQMADAILKLFAPPERST